MCRFHGARAGAPKGADNGAYRHGLYTKDAKALRRAVTKLRREAHVLLTRLKA